jgi:hypothetical protein
MSPDTPKSESVRDVASSDHTSAADRDPLCFTVRRDDSSGIVTDAHAECTVISDAARALPSSQLPPSVSPDDAIRFVIKIAVDAAEYERASALLEVLQSTSRKEGGAGHVHATCSLPSYQLHGGPMNPKQGVTTDRSVHIDGNATANIIQTGDKNTATLHYERVELPKAADVDIHRELSKLRENLAVLKSDDMPKVANALSDAETELKKPKPDKEEVGSAMDRVLKYAKQAVGYAELAEKLKPQIVNVVAWLGANWHSLLGYVGLSV